MTVIDSMEGATKLARAIVADVRLYNQDALADGSESGWAAVAEGRNLFMRRVSPELYAVFESVLHADPILHRYAGGPHGSPEPVPVAASYSGGAAPQVPSECVVVCMGCAVVAMQPQTGAIVWTVPTEQPVVRMFRARARLFAVTGAHVHCIDLSTGAVIGVLDIGFAPEAGMVCGEDLVLLRGSMSTSPDAIVCLTQDGRTRWKGTLSMEGTNALLRTYGPAGEPRSRTSFPFRGGPGGIAYGDMVVQPDLG